MGVANVWWCARDHTAIHLHVNATCDLVSRRRAPLDGVGAIRLTRAPPDSWLQSVVSRPPWP